MKQLKTFLKHCSILVQLLIKYSHTSTYESVEMFTCMRKQTNYNLSSNPYYSFFFSAFCFYRLCQDGTVVALFSIHQNVFWSSIQYILVICIFFDNNWKIVVIKIICFDWFFVLEKNFFMLIKAKLIYQLRSKGLFLNKSWQIGLTISKCFWGWSPKLVGHHHNYVICETNH